MIEFINSFTGTLMQVADERKDEYLAAGHKPVADAPSAKEPVKEEKPVKKTVKKSAKK